MIGALSATAALLLAAACGSGSGGGSGGSGGSGGGSGGADSATDSPTSVTAPQAPAGVALPPANGQFDYQIGGPYTPDASVQVVDRDRSADPVPGRYTICYVNAFQSQPDEQAFWFDQHPDLLLRIDGQPVMDPGWPDEYIFDLTTAAKRSAVAAIVGGWIEQCARDGFQAVEPDNLDAWTRSKGGYGQEQALAFAAMLTTTAHAAGLAIGQKNTGELGTAGRDAGFDFAVAEECQLYEECGDYTDVYGGLVYEIEYTDNPESAYTDACADHGATIAVILRDREVVPRGDPDYVYRAC